MEWNRIARVHGAVWRVLAATLWIAGSAAAQDVNEDYVVSHLGPAAEEMVRAGVDGSPESAATIIEISQRWGVDPAYWVSVDEVRRLVRGAREDRERARLASLVEPSDGVGVHSARLTVARFGIVAVGTLSCAHTKERARLAARLAESLAHVSQLNGAGTGLMGVLSGGAARFVAPMAFATMVTGFAASWAGQLSSHYNWAPCMVGGELWRFPSNVLRTALSHDPSRVPDSFHGQRGWRRAGRPTGPTSKPLTAALSPYRYRWASGSTRSSSSRWSWSAAVRA